MLAKTIGRKFNSEATSRQEFSADCLRDDRHIHPQRPLRDVLEIMIDPRNRQARLDCAAPTSTHLSEACNPRSRRVSLKVVRDQILVGHMSCEHTRHMRSRPNEGHLALNDIDELRNLVEARASQDFSNACDPGIAPHRLSDASDVTEIDVH